MSELTVLHQWALATLKEMLTELSFVFLLQGVELALVAVEIIVVRLLSQMSHDLSGWIVEIPWASICIESLCLVA